MKPEFLDDLTGGGKYDPAIKQLVRLYDFDQEQACQLLSSIRETVLANQETLD